jgi:tellurite resistance protein TehA-like permease
MNNRLRSGIHAGVTFGGAFAVINLVRLLPAVVVGTLPASYVTTALLISFAVFGGIAFALVMFGVAWATPKSSDDRIVSTWFLWMVALALAGFVAGVLLKPDANSFMYWGSLGATVWTVTVLVLWIAFRVRDARQAQIARRQPTRQ